MQVLAKIKTKIQKYWQRQQQKFIYEMFGNCFPKITKEETEELREYIKKKFKDDEKN